MQQDLPAGLNVPLKGRQGSQGGVPDSPGESGLEGKPRMPLSSQVATHISWSPLSGLKGVRPSLQFGESSDIFDDTQMSGAW